MLFVWLENVHSTLLVNYIFSKQRKAWSFLAAVFLSINASLSVVTNTWLIDSVPDMQGSVSGYFMFHKFRSNENPKKDYGGSICFLCRSHMSIHSVSDNIHPVPRHLWYQDHSLLHLFLFYGTVNRKSINSSLTKNLNITETCIYSSAYFTFLATKNCNIWNLYPVFTSEAGI